jgi:glycerol 3-phosphatase-2
MSSVVYAGSSLGLAGSPVPLYVAHDLALLDLDGVVYIGSKAVTGVAQTLGTVRAVGMSVRFVTNNASRPPEAVAEHLTQLGVPAAAAEVVTSAQIAAVRLAQRLPLGAGVLVIGADGLRQAVEAEGLVPMESLDEGPVAVVQGFGPEVGWRRLAEASRAVRSGLFWMVTNLDLTVPTAYGPAPGNGSLVRVVEAAAGRGPDDVAGKPRPGAFTDVVRRAGASRPLVVGDRLDTDLEGAHAAGLPGLLVLTGITGMSQLLTAPPWRRPTYVGRSVGALLVEHPAASVEALGDGGGARGSCGGAVTVAEAVAGRVVVRVEAAGQDPVDLLRAAVVAAWQVLDVRGGHEVDGSAVVEVVRAVEPEAAWAR